MVLGIFVTTGDYIVLFLIMRGDPADPLTAARSLIDFVSWIIMLYSHSRELLQTIMADLL